MGKLSLKSDEKDTIQREPFTLLYYTYTYNHTVTVTVHTVTSQCDVHQQRYIIEWVSHNVALISHNRLHVDHSHTKLSTIRLYIVFVCSIFYTNKHRTSVTINGLLNFIPFHFSFSIFSN